MTKAKRDSKGYKIPAFSIPMILYTAATNSILILGARLSKTLKILHYSSVSGAKDTRQ